MNPAENAVCDATGNRRAVGSSGKLNSSPTRSMNLAWGRVGCADHPSPGRGECPICELNLEFLHSLDGSESISAVPARLPKIPTIAGESGQPVDYAHRQ